MMSSLAGVMAPEEKQSIIGKLKTKALSRCEQEWLIEVIEDAVREERERFFEHVGRQANVPGFRKGKAPKNIIEQHFQKEAKEEIVKHLLGRSIKEAIIRQKEDLIHYPTVHEVQFDNDLLTFKVRVELRPEVKLGNYKSLKARRGLVQVTEVEILQIVDRMQERTATFKVVEGRPVELGDYIVADYTLYLDGKQADSKTNEMFEVNKDRFLPGFGEQTTGLKVGETREIKTELPKDFPHAGWAGKQAMFNLTLKEIKTKVLPEANDNWVVSVSQFKTFEELKSKIAEDLKLQKEQEAEQVFERDLLDALLKQTKLELSEGMVNRRLAFLMEHRAQSLVAYGTPKERAASLVEEKKDELKKEAERQVRVAFTLEEIGKQENVVVGDSEVAERIKQIALESGKSAEQVNATYQDEDRREALRDQIRYEKALQFLKDSAAKNKF